MAADIGILFLCIVLTVFVFFLLEQPVMQMNHLLPYFAINILLSFLTLTVSGAYDVFWLGVVIGQVLSSLVMLLLRWHIPCGFLILNAVLAVGGIVAFRLMFRCTFLILTDAGRVESRKRLLIVGAGSGCELILKEIQRSCLDPSVLSMMTP